MKQLVILALVLVLLAGGALAAKKLQATSPAVTHYLNVMPGARTTRAAAAMTELHRQYHELGYQIIDVDPYVEDGDLEGFFLTYRKR